MKISLHQSILFIILTALFYKPVSAENILSFSSSVGMPFHNSDNSGFEDQLLNEIFNGLGYKIKIQFVPAERALINLDQYIDDGALGRTSGILKNHSQILPVPEEAFVRDFVVFTKSIAFIPDSWEKLKPYNVGIIRGWKILENNITGTKSLVKVKDGKTLFNMLEQGRVDIIIYNRWGGLEKIKELNLKNIQLLEPALVSAPHYFVLNKTHSDLAIPAAKILRSMKHDGRYQKIYETTLVNRYKK